MEPTTGNANSVHDLTSQASDSLDESQIFALHEILQAVARQTDVRESLALIAEEARAMTGADSAAVTLLDATRTLLDFRAVAGADASEIIGQTVRVEDALAGKTAVTGELYLAHHPANARPLLANLDPDLSRGWGVRSAVVVPIYLNGEPSGALAAINRANNESFRSSDVLRLQLLANTAAIALSADFHQRRASQKERERDVLFHAARTTSSSLNVQEVLSSVLATVSDTMEMAAGAIFLPNDEKTHLYIAADSGLNDEDRDRQLMADGEGIAARALLSAQPLLISDALAESAPDELPILDMRSLLLAPMIARSVPEGLLAVGSRRANAYTSEDADLLSAVASQAAVALENAWLYEDATRRAQEAAAIYEMSQTVGATLHLDRMLHFVADSVLALLHVDKFALFLYDPKTQSLAIKIARNIPDGTANSMRPRAGEGIAGWVYEFETPTAVQDVAADHRNRSCPIDTEGVMSLVSVPLQSGEDVIGVLHAMSSRRRLFTVGEMELLYTIANQVGAAITNAQMYEEARKQSDEIRNGVRRVARAIGSSLSPIETAQVIADLATETTQADRSVLFALDEQGGLRPQAASNFKSALSPGVEVALTDEAATAWVARRKRSLNIENWAEDARWPMPAFAQRERLSGYLGVPLKIGKDIIGVLEVYTREPRRFTKDEVRLLITFASQASVALKNAVLVDQANRRLADLRAIEQVSEMLCAEIEPEEFLSKTLSLLCHATQSDSGVIEIEGRQAVQYPFLDAPAGGDDADPESPHMTFALPELPGQPLQGAISLSRSFAKLAYDIHDTQLTRTLAHLIVSRLC